MGGIPLPALDIRPPQQPDAAEQMGRLVQMKGLINQQQMQAQEMQIRAQQLKDQQATTAAMNTWDGKDLDAIPKLVLSAGGSGQAAQTAQQHVLTIKKTVSDMAAQDATTGSKNLETFKQKHQVIGDTLAEAKDIPDEQLHDWATQQVQKFTQSGIMSPQESQQAQQAIQGTQDPQALRGSIQTMAKVAMGAKAVADQQKTAAETDEATQKAAEAKASAAKSQAEQDWYAKNGGAPGVPVEAQQQADWLKKNPGKTPADFLKYKSTLVPAFNFNLQNGAAAADANGNPSQIAQALAENRMKWSEAVSPRTPQSTKNAIMAQVYKLNPNYDTSEFGLEADAAKKARSGAWADTRVAYNTAIDHANQLLTASDALKNGDVRKLSQLKNYFKTEFGDPDVSNFQAIANAYNHEVTSVVSKGHITDAEVAQGHGVLPDNASPEQIRGVAQAYKNLMTSKRDELDKVIKAGAGNKADGVMKVGSDAGGAATKTFKGHSYTQQQDGSWKLTQ